MNVLLIIGLASFIKPIKIRHVTIKKELPILVLITSVFAILMLDSLFNPYTSDTFSRADGIVLLLLFGIFVVYLIQLFSKKADVSQEELDKVSYTPFWAIFTIVVTIICIIYSSDILHISDKLITMFAIVVGTSLPEMVMTVTSAKKGEFDIAIGNIIGTNIFNICIVLGLPVIIYGNVLLTGFGIIDIIMVFLSSALLFFFASIKRKQSLC